MAVINRQLRIVFMGTPGFAVASLQFLLEAGYPIVGVVTAPDKPGGRGMKQMISSPVKQFALAHGLTLLQPSNLKSKVFITELKALHADLQIVVAFRMLPEVIWNMPPLGTMNLHGSLLPAFRGAAPIHWAVIRGEKVTGVTTFLLRHQIDTGQILLQRELPILDDDDTGSVHDRMMMIGAGLVVSSVDLISKGQYQLYDQDESKASHAPKIHHEDGRIHWDSPALNIYNLIRGMSPYPGAWTFVDGIECKIWKSTLYSSEHLQQPGSLSVKGKSLVVQATDGEIEILEVQMAGKKRMSARDFINGYRIKDWFLT
ncbi:MAG TPA: methionyl-tRNA formyltransferase [Saprospiraceae bacterium]|nr:methionyl-tRNA formyltransferase [Saprospiraceae bacterium]